MIPDYYKLFGISKNASKDDVKRKYRQLAKMYHPDVNTSPDATSKMQEIQEAYLILGDDEARARYDSFYDYYYGQGPEKQNFHNSSYDKEESQEPRESSSRQASHNEYKDPILERWVLNAKKQAAEFIVQTLNDTKGIAGSGLKYLSYGCLINAGILLIIFVAILIFRFMRD
jgi:curved DNA-binding protein CbpA